MSDFNQEISEETQLPETGYEPQTITVEIDPIKFQLIEARHSGAGWLNTVALLAIINSALTFLDVNVRFIFGLGFADIMSAVAQEMDSSGLKVVAVGTALTCALIFTTLCNRARKGATWAFVVGMVLYSLDGLLWVLAEQWIEVGTHAFAVWCIFGGFKANSQLKKLYPEG